MGAGQSTSTDSTARIKLLDATKSTRTLIDTILEYLLSELKLRDFYLLSSPTECKKYVLFLANKISSEFIEFQVQPSRNKSGTIAFRSVKDLVEPPEPLKKQRQYLCLELAYFYVRIFQIYGALALSLLDDASYTQQTGFTGFIKDERGVLRPPGLDPYRTTGPTGRFTYTRKAGGHISGGHIGGRVRDKDALGTFKFLNEVLIDETHGARGNYRVELDGKSTSTFFTINNLPVYEQNQKGKFTIYISEKRNFVLNIHTHDSRINPRSSMTLDTITLGGSSTYSIKDLVDDDGDKVFTRYTYEFIPETRRYERNGINVEKTIWKTVDGSSISDILSSILEKLKDYVKNKLKDSGVETDIHRYKTNRNISGVFEEKDGSDSHLHIAKVVDNLTRKRPLAHCVARALQLLETAPLGSDTMTVESKICDSRFLENKVAIPMGKPLSSSAGLSVLANLFYDVIEHASPKIVQSSEDATEYLLFMRTLSGIFMGVDPITKLPKVDAKSLEMITSLPRDKEICGKIDSKESIFLPMSFARTTIYPIVQQLFQRQLTHAANSARILEQLFLIKKSSSGVYEYHIHPNIFKNGITEINRIANLTKHILKQYYIECELKYTDGIMKIKTFTDSRKPLVKPLVT